MLLTFDFASPASAQPTQEDVFRSIQTNVSKSSESSGKGMALLAGAVGVLILVMLVGSNIRRRQSVPKPVDHPKKLLREVMKTLPLKANEMKQLKLLAEVGGQPVQSPLTLLLCPSVLSQSLKNRPAKIDRAVIAQVVRKISLSRANAAADV